MSFLGSILGIGGSSTSAQSTGNSSTSTSSSISGAETIERLCDRLQSASLLEDRRESLTEIKALSKKYKLEVGTQAMPVLIDVLDKSRLDTEMCCLALDSLYNIMTTSDDAENKNLPSDLNIQFTEMFIKSGTNVNLVFDLLDEFEFQTRFSSLKLLNALILNQTQQLQDIILQIPRGVSRLMDLLNDTREIIRNDTILLLNNLTKTNTNIQKIVAFESGFDRIMEIIDSEGSAADGGIVVEDCFNLLLNLLKMNYSNQNFFKEANYVKMLCKYLDLTGTSPVSLAVDLGDSNSSSAWPVQKTKNVSLLLKLIRCLVAPNNQQMIINDCQKAFNHFGMLHRLCAMLMMPGVPAELLGEAICTVGEVIRGNSTNQQMFSAVQMQTSPPRSIIVILLMSMINEKQPFHLRCSILYCFECYLYKNEKAKTNIVETLLPKSENATVSDQINTGQILCSGLFNHQDSVSNWLCAVAISHTISENNQLKEQLLRVQLAFNNASVSLIQQCMHILKESTSTIKSDQVSNQIKLNKFQTTVSTLMLLSTWLANCPLAVNYYLSQSQNIPYLISQVSSTDTEDNSLIVQGLTAFLLGLCMMYNSNQVESYTTDQLKDIIKKRCGIEQFEDKLEYISQHEMYTKTLKMPTLSIKCKHASNLLFDYEFTRLFKSNETLIINLLHNKNQNLLPTNSSSLVNSVVEQQNSLIISQYQQIIRDQDTKLKEQQQEKLQLAQTCAQLQEYCQSLHQTLSSRDELLREKHSELEALASDKLKMHARINELQIQNNLLEEKCSEQEDELCKLQREKGIWQETLNEANGPNVDTLEFKAQNKELKLELDNLNKEQENLLTLLQEMEQKLKKYKNELRNRGYANLSESENEEEDEEKVNKNDQLMHQATANLYDHPPQQKQSIEDATAFLEEENLYTTNNRISEIIQAKNMSNSTSSNSVVDHTNTSISSNTTATSSGSSEDNAHEANNSKVIMNYPPQTGLNIVNATSSSISESSIDPFFQNHPFFSQIVKQDTVQQQQQHNLPLQNYFK